MRRLAAAAAAVLFCGAAALGADPSDFGVPAPHGWIGTTSEWIRGIGLVLAILDIALAHGVDLDHACGGVVACSTCHVVVKKGLETCNEATEDEEDQLDNAPALTPQSRLGCQCVPDGTKDVEIEIPEWNRNLVREEH